MSRHKKGLRKIALGKKNPEKLPPRKLPLSHRKITPRKIPLRMKISSFPQKIISRQISSQVFFVVDIIF